VVRRGRWVREAAKIVERVGVGGEEKLGCQEEEEGSKKA